MTLTYPNFWHGFRWDSERVIADLFLFPENKAAQGMSTGLKVEPDLPDTKAREDWILDGNAWLWVHRLGGHLNYSTMTGTDEAIIQMAGLTSSRANSNELMEYVASMLCAYGRDGGEVKRSAPHRSGSSTTFIKVPDEVVGPQMIPERFRDFRLIPAQWEIHVDLPQGLPDYRAELGLD